MNQIKKISANKIGVVVGHIQDRSEYGYCFLISKDSPVVGCQCLTCNTIIWVNARKNKITSEKRPENVPSSGSEYRKYYIDNINRFLKSIPNCPSCGGSGYEFVNNMTNPKCQSGYVLTSKDQPLIKWEHNSDLEVWIIEE